MDPRDLEILRTNHIFLVENLDLKHALLTAHLVQENLLTPDDVERLHSFRTKKEMANEFLLQILRRRGPTAFETFLKCLVQADSNMHFIAEKLDPDAPARYAVA